MTGWQAPKEANMPAYETVLYDVQDKVARITLNRPDRRNAMNAELNHAMFAALQWSQEDPQVRALLITGAGKGFCSGADLTIFQERPSADLVYDNVVNGLGPVMTTIVNMPKPVIAAVNGVAAGAGAALALACDLRVMAHDASLLMAFTNIGLVPDAGTSWFLARQIGFSRAFEFTAAGDSIPAGQCLELGLANKVVPAADLMDISLALAFKMAGRPTLAVGMAKQALRFAQMNDLQSTIETEAHMQQKAYQSADFVEGVTAFMQKRRPEFKGQ
jgi:2-(1,2-epoxy-1,2-dihydrophenyl)acetyl-CoA isomerase